MWPDGYDKHSFFHLFHTCCPKVEQKNVMGTHPDSLITQITKITKIKK